MKHVVKTFGVVVVGYCFDVTAKSCDHFSIVHQFCKFLSAMKELNRYFVFLFQYFVVM